VVVEARKRGAIVRPLGDVVVLMPPLAISKADLRRLVEIIAASIHAAVLAAYEAGPTSIEAADARRAAEVKQAA
jgi:adenosylmethionine-8-amino-7-oxononanoate aminotransferase